MKSPNIIIEGDSFILIEVLQSPFTRHLVLEVNDIVETDKAAPGGNNFVGDQLIQLLISWQEMPIPDLVFFLPSCLMMLRHSICGKSRCSRAGWLPR
ncbi:hypothetical protein MRB53_002323 [Persea americana]|uniref:Uncharacterized protein n=1 Tax=Persea americana TaxID=3435 RepID=A0ACC2MU75_PERAE|nr:hypothetical protein MRB53_002323 [Persea americana]